MTHKEVLEHNKQHFLEMLNECTSKGNQRGAQRYSAMIEAVERRLQEEEEECVR